MPSRIRRSSRRARRGKRELIWTSVVFEGVSAAVAPGTNSALVLPSDWIRNTGGSSFQKGCVLERIRGYINVYRTGLTVSDAGGTGTENVYASIWKSEEEEDFAGNDWSLSSPYNDEDILWTDGAALVGSTNISAGTPVFQLQQPQWMKLEVDVKARRKLTSDDQIVFTVQSGSVSPAGTYSGVLRALLTLP